MFYALQELNSCMGLLLQIFLLVAVIYLALELAVKTIFGEYDRLFAILTAILVTCFVLLTNSF